MCLDYSGAFQFLTIILWNTQKYAPSHWAESKRKNKDAIEKPIIAHSLLQFSTYLIKNTE